MEASGTSASAGASGTASGSFWVVSSAAGSDGVSRSSLSGAILIRVLGFDGTDLFSTGGAPAGSFAIMGSLSTGRLVIIIGFEVGLALDLPGRATSKTFLDAAEDLGFSLLMFF
jgi:hypothetical protein